MASKEPLVKEMKDGDGCYLGPPKSYSAHRIIQNNACQHVSFGDNGTIPR